MSSLLVFIISFVPGLSWLGYVWWKDRENSEPVRQLTKTFFAGMFAAVMASLVNTTGLSFLPPPESGLAPAALASFLVIAPNEEFWKLLVVWWVAFKHPAFDEPFDGIVYTAAAALGFASLENLDYVSRLGGNVALLRAFTAVPGHFLFVGACGYALAQIRFEGASPAKTLFKGWLIAVFLHGLYDTVCFGFQGSPWAALVFVVLGLSAWMWRRYARLLAADGLATKVDPKHSCPSCGRQTGDGSRFCDGCGVALAEGRCSCGAVLLVESSFCDQCGMGVTR